MSGQPYSNLQESEEHGGAHTMCFRVNLEVANVYVHIPLQKLSLKEAREWSLLQLENNLVVCP